MQTSLPLLLVWTGPAAYEWSPSAISSIIECERKWAWKKIAKAEDPGGAGADLGKRAHAMWERYLTTGERPDYVKDKEAAAVAGTTLHLLPQPKTPGMLVEQHFRFKSANTGLVYHGFEDASLPPGAPQPQLELDGTAPIVIDHKTTKNIAEYAKSVEDLEDNDPQSILYGLNAMARYASDSADLAWIYSQTKGAKIAKPTVTRLHAGKALKVFDVIEGIAVHASKILDAGLQPLDLPPNPHACNGFGGCPYRHLCNLSPSERAKSRMSNSIIAGLRARVQGTPSPAVTEASTEVAPGAVNPPESALEPEVPQAAAPQTPTAGPRRTRRTKEQIAADELAKQAPREAIPEGHDVGQIAADRGVNACKDPLGADAHAHASHIGKSYPPGTEGVPVERVQRIEAPAFVAGEDIKPGVLVAAKSGFTLYVDCIPIGKPARAAAGLIEKAQERILKEHGVPDYRLIDFGKGAPHFIAYVDELVDGTFDLALDTRTPEGAVLLETLKAKASLVVQGLR